MRRLLARLVLLTVVFADGLSDRPALAGEIGDAYLSWNAAQADAIGKKMRSAGRIGGIFDFRGIHTERSYNFKLRATWLTPDVVRAVARLEQFRKRLSDDKTRRLVEEAESAGDTVILVEIDPREGSGVIPSDWQAYLQPKGEEPGSNNSVLGANIPDLREAKGLAGVYQRDYNYDLFWVVFPLVGPDGKSILTDSTQEAELIVRIYNKQGRVTWPVPESIRERVRGRLKAQ